MNERGCRLCRYAAFFVAIGLRPIRAFAARYVPKVHTRARFCEPNNIAKPAKLEFCHEII